MKIAFMRSQKVQMLKDILAQLATTEVADGAASEGLETTDAPQEDGVLQDMREAPAEDGEENMPEAAQEGDEDMPEAAEERDEDMPEASAEDGNPDMPEASAEVGVEHLAEMFQ